LIHVDWLYYIFYTPTNIPIKPKAQNQLKNLIQEMPTFGSFQETLIDIRNLKQSIFNPFSAMLKAFTGEGVFTT